MVFGMAIVEFTIPEIQLRSRTTTDLYLATHLGCSRRKLDVVLGALQISLECEIGAGLSSLGLRKFSILLDTRALEEQYQIEVSLFEARLPLLSPFAATI